jgi:hypothetical protein
MPEQAPSPLEAFSGGKPASSRQVLRGMKALEEEQKRRFEARKQEQAALAAAHAPLRDALASQLGDATRATAGGVRALQKRRRRAKLASPSRLETEAAIWCGAVGVRRTPPYDYQWTWHAKDDSSATDAVSATASSGEESFWLVNDDDGAHAWGACAVGVYFRPIRPTGYVHLSSTPSFTYRWYTYCTLASAHSDAWIGLYVAQYNSAGEIDRVAVDQQTRLWSDDSWAVGAGDHSGANSGYPLTAWFPVDANHWYAMWVWCGGSIYGDGSHTFWGSFGSAAMDVVVPSIDVVVY